MLWVILEFFMGCSLLIWGAHRFIHSCAAIAKRSGLSSLWIGLLLAGFGTSFPELVVSAIAAFKSNAGIAIGNVIGSNIANIGLCVGITALIAPIKIHSQLVKREFPILIIVSLIVGLLFWNQVLSRKDGFILIGLLIGYLSIMFVVVRNKTLEKNRTLVEYTQSWQLNLSLKKAWYFWCLSLVCLLFASEWLINSATSVAHWLHISDFTIGLTIVAVGTSLPELAITVMSVLKNESNIAMGSVIGSNIFNLLAVLSVPALIVPGVLPVSLFSRDYGLMLGMTLLLWLFAVFPTRKSTIGRLKALILLFIFVGYLVYLVLGY